MAERHKVDWNVLERRLQRLHERAVDVMSRELGFDKPPYCKVEVIPKALGSGYATPQMIGVSGFWLHQWEVGENNGYNPPLTPTQMVRHMDFDLLHETGHHFHWTFGPKEALERWTYLNESERSKLDLKEDEELDKMIGVHELIAELFALNYLDITRGEKFFKELIGENRFNYMGHWSIPRTSPFSTYRRIKSLDRRTKIIRQCIIQEDEYIERIPELQRYFRYVNSLATK